MKKGCADDRIAQTYQWLLESGQKITLSSLTHLSGSNRKTVRAWCEKTNIII